MGRGRRRSAAWRGAAGITHEGSGGRRAVGEAHMPVRSVSSPSSVGTKPLRPAPEMDLRKRHGVLAGSAHGIGAKEHAPRRACSKCRMCDPWGRRGVDVGRAAHREVPL